MKQQSFFINGITITQKLVEGNLRTELEFYIRIPYYITEKLEQGKKKELTEKIVMFCSSKQSPAREIITTCQLTSPRGMPKDTKHGKVRIRIIYNGYYGKVNQKYVGDLKKEITSIYRGYKLIKSSLEKVSAKV